MKLRKWLDKKGISVPKFAEMIDAKKSTVYNWTTKHQAPSRIFMKRVIEETKGEVTQKDWE